MVYRTSSQRIGINLNEQSLVSLAKPQVPVGTIVAGVDSDFPNTEGEFVYGFAAIGALIHQCMYLDTINGCIPTSSASHANDGGGVGWALADMAAMTFGWFQISGTVVARVLTPVAVNSKVFITATNGELDDAPLPGCQLLGAEFEQASGVVGPTLAMLSCQRPHIQGQIT